MLDNAEVICNILGAPVFLNEGCSGNLSAETYYPGCNRIHIRLVDNENPETILFILFHEAAHRHQDVFWPIDLDKYKEDTGYWRCVESSANKYAVRQLRCLGLAVDKICAIAKRYKSFHKTTGLPGVSYGPIVDKSLSETTTSDKEPH